MPKIILHVIFAVFKVCYVQTFKKHYQLKLRDEKIALLKTLNLLLITHLYIVYLKL